MNAYDENEKRKLIETELNTFVLNRKKRINDAFALTANTFLVEKLLAKNSVVKFSLLKKNDLTIEIYNIENKKLVRSLLENNASILGGVTIKEEKQAIEILWPPVTLDRRQRAFNLIKAEINIVVEEMRKVRLTIKKTIDIIKDEHVKRRLISYLDECFAKSREKLESLLVNYKA